MDSHASLSLTGGDGDGQIDTIVVNGTPNLDTITLTANAGDVEVSGLSTLVRITTPEVANHHVIINGLTGADIFTIGNGVTSLTGVTPNQ